MSLSIADTTNTSSARVSAQQGSTPLQFSIKSDGSSITTLAEEAGSVFLGKRTVPAKSTKPTVASKSRTLSVEHKSELTEQADSALLEPFAQADLDAKSDAQTDGKESGWTTYDALADRLTWLNETRMGEIYEELIIDAHDAQDLWEIITKHCQDVGSQYGILLYARKITQQTLSSSTYIADDGWGRVSATSRLSQLLNRELPKFESEHQRNLSAVVNTFEVVQVFVDEHQGHTGVSLSTFYQDAVLDYATLGSLYELITERYGARQFEWATGFLNKALQADYDCVGPSLPKARLRAIMNDLGQIRSLESIHLNASKLWHRLKSTYPGLNYRISKLIKEVLDVQRAKVSNPQLFTQLAVALELTGASFNALRAHQYVINLLTGVGEILRLIPAKHFNNDSQKRTKLLKDLQSVLDDLSVEEEDKENRQVLS